MSDSFLQVTSFDPLVISAVSPGPPGPPGSVGPAGPSGPTGPQGPAATAVNWSGVNQTGNYTAAANELVTTDNSLNSNVVTLPTTPPTGTAVVVRAVSLLPPNTATVAAPVGAAFDDGTTSKAISVQGGGYEFEYVATNVWAIRSVSTPLSTAAPLFDAAGAAAIVDSKYATITNRIQASIPNSLSRTAQIRFQGTLVVGAMPTGLDVEQGFTAMGCRALIDTAPVGADVLITASIGGVALYTFTIPAGQTSSLDTAPNTGNGVVIPPGSFITFAATQVGSTTPGANVTLIFAEVAAVPPPTIGSAVGLTLTAQAGAFSGTWSYVAVDQYDELDHYAVRYLAGSTAPTNLSQGTAGPDVSGQVINPAVTVTGLAYGIQYAVAVFPIGGSGAVGTAATGTITTTALDTTPPPSGTIADGGHSSSTVTVVITPDQTSAGADIQGGYLRRNSNTTPPATLTSNKPALEGLGATVGAPGHWVACGVSGITVTDTGLNPSSNYAYSWFPKDTSGNQQLTPATFTTTTSAAPSSGQGIYGLYPSTWSNPFTETFTGRTSAWLQGTNPQWWVGNGWAHQSQGPTRTQHATVIAEPGNTSNNIMRLIGDHVAGWFKPGNSLYTKNTSWAEGVTDGTGWYGARLGISGQTQLYGGYEVRCRTAAPSPATASFGNNWKGGNVQGWPTANWPQQEFDTREQFQAGAMQCNNHYWDPNKTAANQTAGSQLSANWSVTDGNWQVFSFLWYPPGFFGVGTPSRIMTYMDNVLRFDTGLPGTTSPTPSTLSATKISWLLNGPMSGSGSNIGPQHWDLGFSLAWAGFSGGAGFAAATGTGATQRQTQYFDIDSINIFGA